MLHRPDPLGHAPKIASREGSTSKRGEGESAANQSAAIRGRKRKGRRLRGLSGDPGTSYGATSYCVLEEAWPGPATARPPLQEGSMSAACGTQPCKMQLREIYVVGCDKMPCFCCGAKEGRDGQGSSGFTKGAKDKYRRPPTQCTT